MIKLNIIHSVFVFFLLLGCGSLEKPSFIENENQALHVVSVLPEDGSTVSPDADVMLEFSIPVESSSISNKTLAIVKVDPGKSINLSEALSKGDIEGISGKYELDRDGRKLLFNKSELYESGATYEIIATNGVVSNGFTPLSQHPTRPKDAFVSTFKVEGGQAGLSFPGSDIAAPKAKIRPSFLVINEILYDVTGEDTNGQVFIELYGETAGDISDFLVVFIEGSSGKIADKITIPEGAILSDDGIFLVADAKTGESGVSQVVGADLVINFDPQNGPDCIQLLDDKGALIDAIGYGSPVVLKAENGFECYEGTGAAKVGAGKSLSRIGGLDTDNNQVDFILLSVPTPGEI